MFQTTKTGKKPENNHNKTGNNTSYKSIDVNMKTTVHHFN